DRKNYSPVPTAEVGLTDEEFDRLDAYCRERGYKKSTLLARLIRQYLDLEGFQTVRENSMGRLRPPGTR
ncbi:MAG TPA: hypothetical protein VIL86_19025, partial [Tepidisphaeraceae bacterium]